MKVLDVEFQKEQEMRQLLRSCKKSTEGEQELKEKRMMLRQLNHAKNSTIQIMLITWLITISLVAMAFYF
jgi:hypothetical protein